MSCGEFAREGLYHSLAKRCFELRKEYDIEFIDAPVWNEAKYILRVSSMLANAVDSVILPKAVRSNQKTVGSIPALPIIWDGDQRVMA